MALTDLLMSMGVVPDGIVGHSLGEVGCAYADGCLTRREAILSAYWRAKVVLDGDVPPGKMAAVGKAFHHLVCKRYSRKPIKAGDPAIFVVTAFV